MSLPERKAGPAARRMRGIALVALVVAFAGISACTVRPLYNSGPSTAGANAGSASVLSSIAVKPAKSRFEQEVRNHLIFLFSGGAGEPANPAYSLAISVTSRTQAAAIRQVADEDEPSAGTVTLAASYEVTKVGTGQAVASGRRQITSSFDRPRQQFAAARAERDAQNRAARELAEVIRLAVAQAIEATP